jgi:AcrR family transcriptional regulator
MASADDNVTIDLRTGGERDRMVEAAWAVLERSGWDGLKVERVLVQAGLSTRSFYRHFANKNELLAVMLESDIDLLGSVLDISLASWTEPVDQVVAWISDLVHVAGVGGGLDHSRFFLAHWFKLSCEFPQCLERCEDRIEIPLARVIEEGARRGDFTSIDPRRDAHVVRCIAMECLTTIIRRADSEIDPEMLDAAIRFVLHALCGSIKGDQVEALVDSAAARDPR